MKYDDVVIKNVCCPFCHASEGRVLYTVTASESATHFVLPWQNPEKYKQLEQHLINLWQQNTCQVVCCSSCQGAFSSPFVAGDKEFYDLAYQRSGYPHEKWEFKRALDWVKEEIKDFKIAEKKILEIGAGEGAFLKQIIAMGGNPKNISAIEYSDWGRKKLQDLQLNDVSYETIPSTALLNKWQNKFDFIFLFQVLEHLDNLDTKLEFLRSCLRPQGQIIFAVPNPDAIYFNELNGALLDMPPNHVSRFSETSIQKMANRNLFEVKLFEVEPLDKWRRYQQFCYYRYMRNTQHPYTTESFISRLPSRWKIRRIFERLYSRITWLINTTYLGKIQQGSSQLAVLQKV